MSRKLRVLMLSLFVVMFAVSSAFAFTAANLTLENAEREAESLRRCEVEFTLGYDSLEGDDETAAFDAAKFEYNITDASGKEVYWLKAEEVVPEEATPGEKTISITGRAPKVDADTNYALKFTVSTTFKGTEVTKTANLAISVTKFDAGSFVISNFSADKAITYTPAVFKVTTDDYSVDVTFNTETVEGEKVYLLVVASDDDFADNITLPSWLGYKVVSVVNAEDGDEQDLTITKLKVFYSSDVAPAKGTKGTVNIFDGTFADSLSEKYEYKDPIISFDVTYVGLSFDISEDYYATGVTAGTSVDVLLTILSGDGYCASLDVHKFVISPDAYKSLISLDQSGDKAVVTFTAPKKVSKASADYDSVLTLYGTNGVSVDVQFVVTVFSSDISLSVDLPASLDMPVVAPGSSNDIKIFVGDFYGKLESSDFAISGVPAGFRLVLTKVSGDYAYFTVSASNDVEAGTYSADIKITDKAGRTATYNLKWEVLESAFGFFTISEDSAAITVNYGTSDDIVLHFYYSEPSLDAWYLSPDISSKDVDILMSYTLAKDASYDVSGIITLNIKPVAKVEATYKTVAYFTGSDDKVESVDLTINVVIPAISLNPSSVTLLAKVGSTDKAVITYSNASPDKYFLSPDAPASLNFKLTSDDKSITVSIAPTAEAKYSGKLCISDDNGKSGSVSIAMTAASASGDLTIAAVPAVNLVAGGSTTVQLKATNNTGVVTWKIGTVPTGIKMARSTLPAITKDDVSPVFVVSADSTASGDYKVEITASDDTSVKTATVSIKVKGVDATVRQLIDMGYVTLKEDGTFWLTSDAFESDTGYKTVGSIVLRTIDLNFIVDVWALYLNDSQVAVAEVGYEDEADAAASEKAVITPDATGTAASIQIYTANLDDGTYAVKLGVIPTESNQELFYQFDSIRVEEGNYYGVGSASSGCNAGLGMLVSALAAAFFIGRKRS